MCDSPHVDVKSVEWVRDVLVMLLCSISVSDIDFAVVSLVELCMSIRCITLF